MRATYFGSREATPTYGAPAIGYRRLKSPPEYAQLLSCAKEREAAGIALTRAQRAVLALAKAGYLGPTVF